MSSRVMGPIEAALRDQLLQLDTELERTSRMLERTSQVLERTVAMLHTSTGTNGAILTLLQQSTEVLETFVDPHNWSRSSEYLGSCGDVARARSVFLRVLENYPIMLTRGVSKC